MSAQVAYPCEICDEQVTNIKICQPFLFGEIFETLQLFQRKNLGRGWWALGIAVVKTLLRVHTLLPSASDSIN